MKKIIFKYLFILFAVYLTFVFYISNFHLYYLSKNNTRWFFIKNILDKKIEIPQSERKILFLGDSRLNAGLDFTQIPNCWTFASGGATAVEMFFILKKYLKNYPKPDTVFVSISPRFLSEKFAFWNYAVRNGLFSFSDFYNTYSVAQKFPNDTFWDCCSWGKFLLFKLKFPSYYQNDIYINKVFLAKNKNLEFINYMLTHNGSRIHPNLKNFCNCPNYETKYDGFPYSEIIKSFLDSIFYLSEKNNIKVIFFQMPMNMASKNKLKPSFLKDFNDYMLFFQKKYPQFEINDTLIFYSDSLFGDPSHLNEKGKKVFTSYFKKLYFSQR